MVSVTNSCLFFPTCRDEDGHTVVDISFNAETGADFDAWEEQFKLTQMMQKLFSGDKLGGYMLDFDTHAMSISTPRLSKF